MPILYLVDEDLPKIVESDASNLGWGGTLKQVEEGTEKILQFTSGTWDPTKKNYSTIKKEIKYGWNCIYKFDIHLVYKQFLLRTDALVLKKVLTKEIKKLREVKFSTWQALFANFDFEVDHIKGEKNFLPDFLSREYLE